MSSFLGGMMGGGGGGGMLGGMMGGMGGGGGGMGGSALSNLAQVDQQINQTKAAAEGGGSIMNSVSGNPNEGGKGGDMSLFGDLLKNILKKPTASTTRVNDTSIAKGLD